MTVLALALGLVFFVVTLRLLRASAVGGEAIRVARATVATMSDRDLSDREKEVEVRRAAARMLRTFLAITFIAGVALAGPVAIMWAGDAAGLYALDQVAELATSGPFLLGSTIGAVLLWIALERLG